MILRLTAAELRQLAAQIEAYTALEKAGADHQPSNTVLSVDGRTLAYAHWWEDERCYMAEFIDFTPGQAQPLSYHESGPTRDPSRSTHPGT